jgi:hypothetical protein
MPGRIHEIKPKCNTHPKLKLKQQNNSFEMPGLQMWQILILSQNVTLVWLEMIIGQICTETIQENDSDTVIRFRDKWQWAFTVTVGEQETDDIDKKA